MSETLGTFEIQPYPAANEDILLSGGYGWTDNNKSVVERISLEELGTRVEEIQLFSTQSQPALLMPMAMMKIMKENYGYHVSISGGPAASEGNEYTIGISPPPGIRIRGEGVAEDLYDSLRHVDETARQLAEHIRGINDPEIKDARLKQVKAALDAMRCYIDFGNDYGAEEIPAEAIVAVGKSLDKVDWMKVSQEGRAWSAELRAWVRTFWPFGRD